MAEEKWVTWDGLKYYDTKVKSHIDSKLIDLQETVPSKEQFDNLQEVVTNTVKEQTDVTARVDSLQDHIDENEAAIEALRRFDLQVAADIATLQTHMEYTVKKEELNGYATQEFVSNAIRSAELSKDVDLSDYYRRGDVDALINDTRINIETNETAISSLSSKIDDVKEDVTRNHELIEGLLVSVENKAEEVHQHHLSDIIDYVAPDLTEYATKDDLKDEVDKILPELDNVATKEELQAVQNVAGSNSVKLMQLDSDLVDINQKLETIPSIEGLATETYVDEKFAQIVVPDVSGLATKEELKEAINNIEHPTVDLSDYYTKTEVDTKFENIEHPSLDGYATEQWVKDELAKIDPSIPSEYITEGELLEKGYITDAALTNYAKADSIPTKTSQLTNDSNFLTEHQDISGKADKSDLDGLATEQFVTDAISNIKHPDPDLSNYYTKGETDSAINEAIDGIEIPEVDLALYATKAEVAEQVATKANNIPFTTDMFVTNAQGGFVKGDNLNGMSIESILIKLLGLQSVITPDEPDVPETVVDKIIQNQLGMYQVNEAAEIIEIPYNYVTYNSTSYDAAPDADHFYQKLDENGEVLESGYQHVSDENDSMYYVIALPNDVNFNENVSVKVWDTTSSTWADALELQMSSDLEFIESALAEAEIPLPVVPEGYTLWIDATLNTCSGEDFRFIIN